MAPTDDGRRKFLRHTVATLAYRGGKVIATERIESLRRFRDDVREVAAGFECGVGLSGGAEFGEGDIIECYSQQTVSRAAS